MGNVDTNVLQPIIQRQFLGNIIYYVRSGHSECSLKYHSKNQPELI